MPGDEAPRTPQRLKRALAAFVRQELSAPTSAIVGFADILLEDAARHGPDDFIPDLKRIRAAGLQLQEFLTTLLDPQAAQTRDAGGDLVAFSGQLRHDLRTPLNAVKGYGEMLLEEARDNGRESLIHDLTKLLASANQMLTQVDAVADFGRSGQGNPVDVEPQQVDVPFDVVSDVLDTIRPISDTGIDDEAAIASRVLVVDDTAANRDLLSRRLVREGHIVEMAIDGETALQRIAETDFDLVLLDLMMPGMNGFEVLSHLKAEARTRHIPVIMISALDELDSVIRCIEAGAEDYLAKPFNPVLLRARINASLEKKRLRDREQSFTEQLKVEKEKSEALLLNILPKTIVARMRQGEVDIADRFAEVTILFSDLVGFTTLAAKFPPSRVIDLLNRVFSAFDRLAGELGLEKIKTIGDAYMVAGGLPEPLPDHAAAAAAMAVQMIEVVRATSIAVGEPLQIRVGIHTGAAIAGIIGRHRFIYDVWGDTVNTASRMESHGLPNRVHLSAATHLRIREQFPCEPRGPLEIKGMGTMETFLLRESHR
jgi:class 3 adenylate cyclase/CheY-like chemotaxis protein